jgi:hypothetical protein
MKKYLVLVLMIISTFIYAEEVQLDKDLSILKEINESLKDCKTSTDIDKEILKRNAEAKIRIIKYLKENPSGTVKLQKEIEIGVKSEAKIENTFYFGILLDILVHIDGDLLLQLTKEICITEEMNKYYKNQMFNKVFTYQRMYFYHHEPEKLSSFDKKLSDFARELFSDFAIGSNNYKFKRGKLNKAVSCLIGYDSDSPLTFLPPINRPLGIKLARNAIKDKDFMPSDKMLYRKQLARFDDKDRKEYYGTLKEYVEANRGIEKGDRTNYKYANILEKAGLLDSETVKKIDEETTGSVIRYQTSNGKSFVIKEINGKEVKFYGEVKNGKKVYTREKNK